VEGSGRPGALVGTGPFAYHAVVQDVYQQIIQTLSKCKNVLITTHVRPDGDAIGTTSAMHLGLKRAGIDSQILLLSHLPRKYAFLYGDYGISHHDAEERWPVGLDVAAFDALLVCDTGTWSQLPGLKERTASFEKPKIVLDHHLTQENWATHKLVIPEASAAGEIAAELLEAWEIPLDSEIATCLYVAIASDTGWFQFSNTRPFTHRLAATLMECGVDTEAVYRRLYQNERAERIALQTHTMQSLELLAGGRLAVMRIARSDFEKTRAHVNDTENLINIPLAIRTVEVAVLLMEPLDFGPIRCSLRSKGKVDVARFAEQFGGGGHARAAGLKLDGTLQEAHTRVVNALVTTLESAPDTR
jgi:phosphoesterase RecJ-like protein